MLDWLRNQKIHPRKCQLDKHQKAVIQHICLRQNCYGKRLVCQNCQPYHKGHQLLDIRQHQISKFKYLYANCQVDQRQYHQKLIGKKYKNIKKGWEQIKGLAEKHCNNIERKLNDQFQALAWTFNKQIAEKILRCFIDGRQDKKYVDDYSKIARIHEKRDFHLPIENIYKQVNCVQDKLMELFNKTYTRIDNILLDMYEQIDQWNLLAPDISNKADKHWQDSRIVSITNNSQNSIIQYLKQKRKKTQITQLSIFSDSKKNVLTPQIISEICKLTSLQKIHIRWAESLSENDIHRLINTSKKLTNFTIENCPNFTNQAIQELIRNKHNVQKLQFGVDVQSSFKFVQDWQFIDFWDKQSKLSFKDYMKLQQFQNLTNIHLYQCNSDRSAQFLSQFSKLNSFKFGLTSKPQKIHEEIIKILEPKRSVKHLVFENISNIHSVNNLFNNKKMLKTLVLSRCNGLTDNILQVVARSCTHLKTLQLFNVQGTFEGTSIWNMDKLQTLQINQCISINQNQAKKRLSDLKKLENLGLSNNPWVDDDFMMPISTLNNLKKLIIQKTNVSGKGIQELRYTRSLQTLICGQTQVDGQSLMIVSKYLRNIRKLDIQGIKISNDEMLEIAKNIPRITHLRLYWCQNLTDEAIQNFQFLECAIVSHTKVGEQMIKKLQNKGVVVE